MRAKLGEKHERDKEKGKNAYRDKRFSQISLITLSDSGCFSLIGVSDFKRGVPIESITILTIANAFE